MLHIKFSGNRSNGSGPKKIFEGFLTYGHGGHVGHDQRHVIKF